MSLKAFHIVFIVCSVLLSAGLGVWGVTRPGHPAGDLVLGILGFVAAAGLIVYGVWFLKKLKGVSYL